MNYGTAVSFMLAASKEAPAGGASIMMGRRCTRLVAGALLLGSTSMAWPFVQDRENNGAPDHWASLPIHYGIGNGGSLDVHDDSEFAAVRNAIATWDNIPNSSLAFQEDATMATGSGNN